ncbi:MAG: Hsp20/alpha crystallin family protein [Chitinophagaceae bacterium]|jgi:HSP20 family protein|nr:Hsp20/alpha crystallin family protein [Chitinophagaceae bacterium]
MSNITKSPGNMLRPFFRDFFDVENFFNKPLFNDMPNMHFPAVNISETDTAYDIELAVPGFKKEDFTLKVEDDVLTISAEGKTEEKTEEKNYSRREYHYAAFTRSFRLPDNAKDDDIKAGYKDGMLHLSIPKTTETVKATKEIKID